MAWPLLASAFIAMLTACNKNDYEPTIHDPYSGMYVPHYIHFHEKGADALNAAVFSIDHFSQHIFNREPLAFKTELDSAYMNMYISHHCVVKVKNLETGGVQEWSPVPDKKTKELKKIEIKGGRLEISVEAPEKIGSVTYRADINVYPYDPLLLTWTKGSNALPVSSADACFYQDGDRLLFLAIDASASAKLLKVFQVQSLKNAQMTLLREFSAEFVPCPSTLVKDTHGEFFALDIDGFLLKSTDLLSWNPVTQVQDLKFSSLWYDANLQGPEGDIALLGVAKPRSSGRYAIYAFDGQAAKKQSDIERANFPIGKALVHSYDEAGIRRVNLIGGIDMHGRRVEPLFFSANGKDWGALDYRLKGFKAPKWGATLFGKSRELYLVGGELDGKAQGNNKIYLSKDHGASWIELTEKQGPDKQFEARTGAAAIKVMEDGDEAFYIYAGAVNAKPTADIWRGYVKKD